MMHCQPNIKIFLYTQCRCRRWFLYQIALGDTHKRSVGLPWTSNRPVLETSTWQHINILKGKTSIPRSDSNPQSLQVNGCRGTCLTASATGNGKNTLLWIQIYVPIIQAAILISEVLMEGQNHKNFVISY